MTRIIYENDLDSILLLFSLLFLLLTTSSGMADLIDNVKVTDLSIRVAAREVFMVLHSKPSTALEDEGVGLLRSVKATITAVTVVTTSVDMMRSRIVFRPRSVL